MSQFKTQDEPGPTGKFPEGKLNKHDEGEMSLRVGSQNGKVVLDFGKPTAWIGMPASQAVDLAELLLNHAARVGFIRPVKVQIGTRRGGEAS